MIKVTLSRKRCRSTLQSNKVKWEHGGWAECTVVGKSCWWVCLRSSDSHQFSSISSIVHRRSQWKASMKRWVLSPAWNWLWLMDGKQRCSGSELQTTGAAMKKLSLQSSEPSCSSSWNKQIAMLGWVETRTARIVSDCASTATEVGRPGALDTVRSQCSNCELYPLRHWQPMEDTAKNWCDVLIFTKTDNETSNGVEYHLKLADDYCRCTIEHCCIAVVNLVCNKRSSECVLL